MKRIIILFLLLSCTPLFSQSKIDSLQTAFESSVVDADKVKILHQLVDEYRKADVNKARETVLKSIEFARTSGMMQQLIKSHNKYAELLRSLSENDSAIAVYEKSMAIAEKNNLQLSMAEAAMGLGYCYLRRGDYKNALRFHEKGLQVFIDSNYVLGMAKSYGAVGDVYSQMREYAKGMENYVKSAEKGKTLDDLNIYGVTLSNMGMLFIKMENYKSATTYLTESDSIFTILNNENGRAYVQYTLGQIYMETGPYDKAIAYTESALKTYEKLGRKNEAGHVLYNLGTIYWRQDKFKESLAAFKKKLDISIWMKDSVSMSSTHKAIGDCYLKLNDITSAKKQYLVALDIADLLQNDRRKLDIYAALSDLYALEKDYKKAFENERNYGITKNRITTKEKGDIAEEIEAKYQNEQKAKENALLAKDNDLQALKLKQRINERNVLIAFALLALILGLLLYNQFRIKQKANKKLQELDRLKSNFFTNISHEFRTPLTLIKGPIEQLEQNPEEQLSTENVKMIRRNANRLLKLVNQLLELSKADEGSLHLEATEGDVYKCLRAVTSSFNSHAAQRHIDYRVSIPKTVLWTSFDRDKLEIIIYNLLSNAFKFSEDTSVITCDVGYTDHNLNIEVSDSGKGIPKEQLPMIFDRFYQVENGLSKEGEGSGIGLSIAKTFVDLMDGTITVSSEINKGTYFTIQLPMEEIKTRTSKADVVEVSPQRTTSKNTYTLSKTDDRDLPIILLIEDNEDMRHFISEQLIENYKIRQALNGEEGFLKAVANPPDLIITDLMMPKMDGMELCHKLKSNLATSHVPIIMLTAKAGMVNKIEGLETGADDYLTKPFNAKELQVRAKNLIEQRKQLRELFSNIQLKIDPKNVTVTSVDHQFLQDLLNLLEDKFSEPDFGVPQMQDALAMSKTQLHRKLKALTNEAPGELLRNFRLKRAAQLLSQDADNVTQIAYSVGFNNLSYFAKCFKEVYGVSPSSYASNLPK